MHHLPTSLSGFLLVSHPQLQDTHFKETVVLIHRHSGHEGAIGVILNRPIGRSLGEVDTDTALKKLAMVPIFEGGPVATNCLAFGGWTFSPEGPIEMRFGLNKNDAFTLSLQRTYILRAYVGYSGWSPGQLEHELSKEAWVVCPFSILCAHFDGIELWKRLLANHRPDLRLEADSPEDIGLN